MENQVGTLTFLECCQRIVMSAKADPYARAYASAGITLFCENASRETLRVQALYILNNLSHWREPDAKMVRKTLKDFSKKSKVSK